ncbi:MAG: hypothetical protein MPL62_14075 [Alphaproteobacteria bacterium]|nr:hypothetical protein [Alphaproteobacteria bacterium]
MDALDVLGTGLYSNSFSSRGKRQIDEVDRFKRAIGAEEQQELFERFAKHLMHLIRSCIAEPAASKDRRREKSYSLFYSKRIGELKKLWNDIHSQLRLPQHDPIWTQSLNQILFNQSLVSCIGVARQEQQPTGCTVSEEPAMGTDEENIIRYMAGYIPFKLMKVYEKRDTQEDANVLDCLSDMAIAGPVDDFYAYTQEWTKSVNRGGLFEVKDVVFTFFRKLEILTRSLLPQHLLAGTVSKEDVHAHILQDEDLLFNWDIISCQLSHETSRQLLKDVADLWLTIRGHAFVKQIMEEHKAEKGKLTKKSKALRKQI